MSYWPNWKVQKQAYSIFTHDGETYSTRNVREIFGIGPTTNIRTTWMFTAGHLTRPRYGKWTIHAKSRGRKKYCEEEPWTQKKPGK